MTSVLHVGIHTDHEFGGDKVLARGLAANGCVSEPFDYRTIAAQQGREHMNRLLRERAAGKDIVFIGKGESLDHAALADVRRKGTLTVLWYGDLRPRPEPWLLELLPEIDVYFMTSAGSELQAYRRLGCPGRAAFFLNPGDSFLAARYARSAAPTRNVVVTATPHAFHGSERLAVLRYLCRRRDVAFYGGCETQGRGRFSRLLHRMLGNGKPPSPFVRGDEYAAAICSARIGVGVSYRQDVPRYTSDRLSHYLTLGAFYLPMRFVGIEDLFAGDRELVWYSSVDELDRQIRRYLADSDERQAIAASAQRKMVGEYGTENMVAMMLEVIRSGKSSRYPWVEVHG